MCVWGGGGVCYSSRSEGGMGRIINGGGWEGVLCAPVPHYRKREKKRKEKRECLFVGTQAGNVQVDCGLCNGRMYSIRVSVEVRGSYSSAYGSFVFRFVVTNTDDDVLALTSVVSVLRYTAKECNRGVVLRLVLHG